MGVWLSLKHRNLGTGLYYKLRDAAKSARDKIFSDLWCSFRVCFKWKELTAFSVFLMVWRETFFFDFYLADKETEQQNGLIDKHFTQLLCIDLSNYNLKVAAHRGTHET
jgi:hypothetical protein